MNNTHSIYHSSAHWAVFYAVRTVEILSSSLSPLLIRPLFEFVRQKTLAGSESSSVRIRAEKCTKARSSRGREADVGSIPARQAVLLVTTKIAINIKARAARAKHKVDDKSRRRVRTRE